MAQALPPQRHRESLVSNNYAPELARPAVAASSSITTLPAGPARRISGRPALYLLASLVVSLLAASAPPTPLYATYAQEWGFTPVTTTIIFRLYAAAVAG